MGRADKTTLPQQSNRQDIANRPKETLQADHTDQNRSSSTGFWYLPHLFQFLQAPAATDSWAALIVGEHIYFERLVGSFESPSNTFFFFSSFTHLDAIHHQFVRPTQCYIYSIVESL